MNWSELIGKKVAALRGAGHRDFNQTWVTPLSVILFDDGETIMVFSEQDPYDYHDAAASARHIRLYKDKNEWLEMFENEGVYGEPDDTAYPF